MTVGRELLRPRSIEHFPKQKQDEEEETLSFWRLVALLFSEFFSGVSNTIKKETGGR